MENITKNSAFSLRKGGGGGGGYNSRQVPVYAAYNAVTGILCALICGRFCDRKAAVFLAAILGILPTIIRIRSVFAAFAKPLAVGLIPAISACGGIIRRMSFAVFCQRLSKVAIVAAVMAMSFLVSPFSLASKHDEVGGGYKIQPAQPAVESAPAVATPSIEFVRIKMGKSIFLDPPEEDEPGIYVRIRDTSGNDFNLQSPVADMLRDNGFNPSRNAKKATYVLQANLLFAEEVSEAELQKLNESDYDENVTDVIKGAIVGTAVGGAADIAGGSHQRLGAGSIAGAIIGGVIAVQQQKQKQQLLTEKKATKFFTAVVDIEVRQRALGGEVIRRGKTGVESDAASEVAPQGSLSGTESFQGSASTESQEVDEYTVRSKWIRHRVRIIASAKGKHVTLDDVKNPLLRKLSNAIGGMF